MNSPHAEAISPLAMHAKPPLILRSLLFPHHPPFPLPYPPSSREQERVHCMHTALHRACHQVHGLLAQRMDTLIRGHQVGLVAVGVATHLGVEGG